MRSLGVLLLALAPTQENRLWQVELEVRGACEAVRLDCGPDGETLVRGPFGPGEDRRLVVPVPSRSPLGRSQLEGLPLPRALLVPADAAGGVRVLGWSAAQSVERIAAAGIEPVTHPPVAPARVRPRLPELLVALLAGGFLLYFRRRPVACLGVGAAGAALILFLGRGRGTEAPVAELVQWHASSAVALRVRGAYGDLVLAGEGLHVAPAGARIALEWEPRGHGRARAEGNLFALESLPSPALAAARNGAERLAEAWTRTPEGRWRAHGEWASGAALGPGRDGVPPGWLSSALPPGHGILVARTGEGTWYRCLDFAVP